MEEGLQALAGKLGEALVGRNWLLGCAESCTGGLLSSILTDAPGASAWFAGAVVAYANAVKRDVLGVPQDVLDTKGAVSRETVLAMARGAHGVLRADVAVAITAWPGQRRLRPKSPWARSGWPGTAGRRGGQALPVRRRRLASAPGRAPGHDRGAVHGPGRQARGSHE